MLKTSIRNKLIVLLLLITIIPFGSSIIVTYLYTKESLKDQSIQENINLLYQGKVNIESYLKELNNFTFAFYNNPDFMNYLRKNEIGDYVSRGVAHNVLQSLLYSDESVNKVTMAIVKHEDLLTVSRRSAIAYSRLVKAKDIDYYKKARENPANLYIEPLNAQDRFTIHRAFRDVPAIHVLAYVSLEIRPDKINELSKYLYHEEAEEFYILTQEGHLIYSSEANSNVNEQLEWKETLLTASESNGTVAWKDENFDGVMIYETTSDATGSWILVKRIPNMTLYESAYSVAIINIFFGVIGLSLVILATLLVSFKITSPIRVLLQNIKQVEKGNMQVQFQTLGTDEIGVLGDRFKTMIEKINQLINREYKLELENKTNQLKVLHSQINPHFLYNTLQSIGTMALKNKVPEVYTSLTDLSQIMRYSMNMEHDIVPLEKEINYTKAYMLLQKQRFGDDLEYHLDIDELATHVKVPKMILQPIIENYFKHGFEVRNHIGKLTVKCKKKDQYLFISISDNGIGVSEQRLKEIRQHLYEEKNQSLGGDSIGLKNVYERLKLYYSEEVSFKLRSRDSGGFLITIRLPIEMGLLHEGDNR
ncbi:sensor histidine kinase [Halalkalibacter alkalisediminis]|uniref:histidine kinase n=1 Tax=Halalkalibacter alkalisediminis TaxID=935616 RepID=A0ABV6NDJ3_9BACI|nr:sensor histidine kinase [Halalkalibacter alkalisediminis]